jgi:ADP-ribose pyrophosphatase YjhB (NUDIX family)
MIVRKEGKIAFILRQNTTWMNGFYSLPSGKIEKNEPYTLGAVREAREEIGVEVNPQDLKFVHVMHRSQDSDWVDIYFEIEKWAGEPINAEPHLHGELVWFDPQKMPENIVPCVRFALEQIEQGKYFSEFGFDQN